jgi:hypothetical protein
MQDNQEVQVPQEKLDHQELTEPQESVFPDQLDQ